MKQRMNVIDVSLCDIFSQYKGVFLKDNPEIDLSIFLKNSKFFVLKSFSKTFYA